MDRPGRRRIRFDNVVSTAEPTGTDWGPPGIATLVDPGEGAMTIGSEAGRTEQVALTRKPRPRDMSPRDWVVYLLHIASEVEHALLVQYLYAMYSLDEGAGGPADNDPANMVSASSWIDDIRGIAIEEMGHLLTVQNALRFVGGPSSFAREDFPIPTEVYPFAFQLEPLTKDVLAKYVFAEMPDAEIDPTILAPDERKEIEDRAKKAAGVPAGKFANHVGTLYASLLHALGEPPFQDPATAGFPGDTERYQAKKGFGWVRLAGNESLHPVGDDGLPAAVDYLGARLLTIDSIGELIEALSFIAQQGEASDPGKPKGSHFERFLTIYREFPEPGAAAWKERPPTFPVAMNPTTSPVPDATLIGHRTTKLWARLFDLRYRILLASLAHATAIPRVAKPGDPVASDATKTVVRWVFEEMTIRPVLTIAELAKLLARMPMRDSASPGLAGAPFGMPYTVTIPDGDHDGRDLARWRYHLDLLDSSAGLVAELRKEPSDPRFPVFDGKDDLLAGLQANDDLRRARIQTLLKPGP